MKLNKKVLGIALILAVSAHFAIAESTSQKTQVAAKANVLTKVAPVAVKQTTLIESQFSPIPAQVQAANMAAEFLTRFHYKPMPLDDAMSNLIFDRYLKSLDADKIFFLQSDIENFNPARTKLDNAILSGDLTTPFAMFNLYHSRFKERLTYAREILKSDFDFSKEESYLYQREKEPWPATEEAMRDVWRQRVKNDWLRLKLAGKEDRAIRTTLDKRYETTLSRMNKLKVELAPSSA